MREKNQIEIERKYLIRMPERARLESEAGVEIWDVEQTYLTDGADGRVRRVRRVRSGGETRYVYTEKLRLSDLSSRERERELSEAEYGRLMEQAAPELRTIVKRRYRIPWAGRLMEIDVYSFWTDRATLEIELEDEAQAVGLPPWVELIRDVSGEGAYRNRALAERVPMEALE